MLHRRGFTLVELLVVISVVALLVATLLPALAKARETAFIIKCLSNQRQIFYHSYAYAGDFNDRLPARGASHFARYPQLGHLPTHQTYPWGIGSSLYDNHSRSMGWLVGQYARVPVTFSNNRGVTPDGDNMVFTKTPQIFACPSGGKAGNNCDYFIAGWGGHQYRNVDTLAYLNYYPVGWPQLNMMSSYQARKMTFSVDMYNHTELRKSNIIANDGSGASFGWDTARFIVAEYGGQIPFPAADYTAFFMGDLVGQTWGAPINWFQCWNANGTATSPPLSDIRAFGYASNGK